MAWTMEWHDLLDNTDNGTFYTNHKAGDIPAVEREFTFRMTSPSTISFKVPLAHPMGKRIAQAPEGFGYVALYQDGVLRMNAEVTSNVITGGQGASMAAINASEPLRNRLAAMPGCANANVLVGAESPAPFTFPLAAGQAGAKLLSDRGLALTAAGFSYTTAGTTASISPSSWDLDVTLLDLFDALANRASGFDYWLEPAPIKWYSPYHTFTLNRGAFCGNLRIEALRGSAKPAARIEYGTGRLNAKDYTLSKLSGDNLVTASNVVSQANPADTPVMAFSGRDTEYGTRILSTLSDLETTTLRQQLADEIVNRRGLPRTVAGITPLPYEPGGSTPRPLVDYGLGDIIPIKVVDEGLTLINGNVRVYGIIVKPDENDVENAELELTPDTN